MSWRCWMRGTSVALALALCTPLAGWARCTLSSPLGGSSVHDDSAAPIPFGRVNLDNAHLQPPGTLLAATIVPPTNFTHKSAHADSVLWRCDLADLPELYFLVSTNGDDRVGGYVDASTNGDPDLPGVYATWFAYVGIKLIMQDVVLSRRYQKVALTDYDVQDNKVLIRLRHVPVLRAELYRISKLPPRGQPYMSEFCAGHGMLGMGYASSVGTQYRCNQPNAYIQLHGPGLHGDEPGVDHLEGYEFWWAGNGFGYGMHNSAILSNHASCVVRNNTPVVTFPTIAVRQLQQGLQLAQNFSVQIACSDQAQSGINAGQTAIGIQVSLKAWQVAQALGLVTSAGGVTHLMAEDYDDPNTAKGVGVTVQNPTMASGNLVFVGPDQGGNPGGNAAGWYPVLAGASPTGVLPGVGIEYRHTFTATLARVNGQAVTPGNFQASATILVKIQ